MRISAKHLKEFTHNFFGTLENYEILDLGDLVKKDELEKLLEI